MYLTRNGRTPSTGKSSRFVSTTYAVVVSMSLQLVNGSSPLRFQVPKRLIRTMRVFEPFADRVPPLTFRAITAGRTARSAALLSDGTPSQSTNENSSPRNDSISRA